MATSYAANPERIQAASTQAPYISLYIKMDVNFDKAILQIRDGDTGDVVRQIPTESQLEAYRRAQTSNSVRPRNVEEDVPVYTPESDGSEVAARESVPAPVSAPAPAPTPQASSPAPQQAAPVSIDTEA